MKQTRTVKMPLRRPAPKPRAATPKLRSRASSTEEDYDVEDYEAEAEPNMRFSHALFVVLILHVIAVGGVFAFNSIKARQAAEATRTAGTPATAPAENPTTAPAQATAPAGPRTHTVVAGDTLTRIAGLYGTTIEALEKANGITTYSTIRVGQILTIPDSATSQARTATNPPAQATSAPTPAIKTVQARVINPAPKSGQATAATTQPERFIATDRGNPPPAVAPGSTYTVEKGDNPYSIARKFGVSYQQLIELNNIEDPTKVQIGQVLKLPAN